MDKQTWNQKKLEMETLEKEKLTERRETVDPETRAYISSLVSAVGGTSIEEGGKYVLGDDAIGCLQDLRRWHKFFEQKLHRLDVQRVLAESNFLKGDILEILAGWDETATEDPLKSKVMLLCLELLVPMTWAFEMEEDQIRIHHHQHLPYLRLAQVGYKRAILKHDSKKILRQIIRIALPSMAEPRKERSIRDETIIKLVLFGIRNVAQISQPLDLPADGDEVEISRSTTIDAFHYQDVFQFILTMSSGMGDEFDEQDVVVLEALFHVLKGIDPKGIFKKDEQALQANTDELRELMRKEKKMLSGYARYAPTRHNRFGTMVWLKRDDERMSTISGQTAISGPDRGMQHMNKTKKWNKPKNRGRNVEDKGSAEFDIAVPLTVSARRHLRQFVEEFLDTSFNPLFSHLRKSIERDVERLVEVHRMQFFYLISWFLEAECARRAQAKESRADKGKQNEGTEIPAEDESFAIIAGVMNQETFVLMNRNMQRAQDTKPVNWNDLNAVMKCFTQILLTVQQMSESTSEDDQEIAENIQNRIFYEETTHDRILSLLRSYKDQGFGYLDACTDLAHVFVRMLERYSKQNSDLHVRSKRRARKKKRKELENGAEGDIGDGNSSADDERQAEMISRERKFDFTRFSARFMTQGCVDTFVSLTRYYKDLSPEQLKRCHRFFYREAFKMDLSTILFRVDIIQLFYDMIKGPECLDHELSCFKEWEELVRQLFRRLTKRLKERPELMIEMLFSKVPSTLFYLEHGFDREVIKSAPRPPAELEITPNITPADRINVVATVLILDAKFELISWIKDVLFDAVKERKLWFERDAATKNTESGSTESADTVENQSADVTSLEEGRRPPAIIVKPEDDNIITQMFKNNKFRLLMNLVGFQRLDDDVPAATWIIPSVVSIDDLEQSLDRIKAAELGEDTVEYDETHPGPLDCLRRKKPDALERPRAASALQSDSEGNESIDEEMLYPKNLPDSRKRDKEDGSDKKKTRRLKKRGSNLTEAEKARRAEERRKADNDKRGKIKSALYIHDSDDETDEEKDKEFFAKEEEQRKKAGQSILKVIKGGSVTESNKRKNAPHNDTGQSAKKRRRSTDSSGSLDIEELGHNDNNMVEISSDASTSDSDQDSEMNEDRDPSGVDEETDTPVSSQLHAPSPTAANDPPRGSQASKDVMMADGEDDEDEPPIQKNMPVRRNIRAGFIIDESDSD